MQDPEPLRQSNQSELRTSWQSDSCHLLGVVAELLDMDTVRAQESDIELDVVPYEPRIADELLEIVSYGVPIWCLIDVCLGYACERNDEIR